jgi:hypothetical protein
MMAHSNPRGSERPDNTSTNDAHKAPKTEDPPTCVGCGQQPQWCMCIDWRNFDRSTGDINAH